MDWPKPPVPEIMPTRVRPRASMSVKIFSQAMRSVCGVLKDVRLHRVDDHHGAGQRDERDALVLVDGNHRHGRSGGRAADHGHDLVVLDEAGGEGARAVGVARVVVMDQADRLARRCRPLR